MAKTAKISRQAQLQAALDGIAKHYANVTTLTFGGATVAVADLKTLIQQELDSMKASAIAKAAYAGEVQQERNARAKLSPTFRQFRNYVFASFGDTQDAVAVLGDFGFSPRKTPKVDVATKAAAAKASEATRAARGTKGKKQKAKIHGAPQGTPAVTPPPAPKS